MKKIILLFAVLLLTACGSEKQKSVSDYEEPSPDKPTKLEPIKVLKLGGPMMSNRYLLLFDIDGDLWYEYWPNNSENSVFRPYPSKDGEKMVADLDGLTTGDTDDGV